MSSTTPSTPSAITADEIRPESLVDCAPAAVVTQKDDLSQRTGIRSGLQCPLSRASGSRNTGCAFLRVAPRLANLSASKILGAARTDCKFHYCFSRRICFAYRRVCKLLLTDCLCTRQSDNLVVFRLNSRPELLQNLLQSRSLQRLRQEIDHTCSFACLTIRLMVERSQSHDWSIET
jgi:hypothetical protein